MQEYRVGESQQQHLSFVFDQTVEVQDMHIRVYAERNAIAVVEILIVNVSIDIKLDCIMQGEGADVCIKGIYLVNASHKVTITTMQHHKTAYTRSNLIIRGVVHDNAQVHYHGTIRVEKEAHGTHASQENKNMVMSSGARVISVPNLEVFAHDVRCFHGSAIGKFDKEQLLYITSRGIDEKVAQKLLLQAFFGDFFVDAMLNERVHELIG